MAVTLDHVVFGCLDLGAGAAALTDAFGAPPAGRGAHQAMSTHNALWNMGDAYIELVAIDPAAPDPGRPRWFGLDDPGVQARLADEPRLLTWVAATRDAAAVAAKAPAPFGAPEDFARDDLRWRMAVPEAGLSALDGVFPNPIEWVAGLHPAKRLGDQGLRCAALTLSHERIDALEAALGAPPRGVACKRGQAQLVLDIETRASTVSFRAY